MSAGALALAIALAGGTLAAHGGGHDRDNDHDRDGDHGRLGRKVFVIAMENHNWTQPASVTSPEPIFQNPAAPFINSLVDGTSGISDQVAYAANYLNSAPGVHPSEPNYIWAEAGTNFTVFNDNQPYHADCTPDSVQTTDQHLSAFLTRKHRTWKSYQEDTDVDATNTPLPAAQWTVPLFNLGGSFTAPGFNPYNYDVQINYAAKHNPMVFFTDTNGGCDTSTSNPLRLNYAPLQQLAVDLQSGRVADYNWITPNQYNDMHTSLNAGFGKFPKSDDAQIAQADNFLARVVPLIMASDAYQDGGIIVLWWDESERGDTADFTLPFIVISKDVHANAGGKPFASHVELSHSSTLRTMQEIFDVDPFSGFPWLGAAASANDLSSLFRPGVIH
jgi:hypothetical protein